MKMLLAMIDSEDVEDTVNVLNEGGFLVTKLSTTGGFQKNKNETLMIGTEANRVPEALDLIKKNAGVRDLVRYSMPMVPSRAVGMMYHSMIPVEGKTKGCSVFVFGVEKYETF